MFDWDGRPKSRRIVKRCLDKDPGRRFQTARDLCIELEELEKTDRGGEARQAPSRWRSSPSPT